MSDYIEVTLKPCPFCNSKDVRQEIVREDGIKMRLAAIVCNKCKAQCPVFPAIHPNYHIDVADNWNSRGKQS